MVTVKVHASAIGTDALMYTDSLPGKIDIALTYIGT
jgi:hypothetical protein